MAALFTVQCVYFYKSNSDEIRTPHTSTSGVHQRGISISEYALGKSWPHRAASNYLCLLGAWSYAYVVLCMLFSILDGVIGIFNYHIPTGCTTALGSNHLAKYLPGIKAAGCRSHFHRGQSSYCKNSNFLFTVFMCQSIGKLIWWVTLNLLRWRQHELSASNNLQIYWQYLRHAIA